MNLATSSPVEIDTTIARLDHDISSANQALGFIIDQMHREAGHKHVVANRRFTYYAETTEQAIAGALKATVAKYEAAAKTLADLVEKVRPLNEEYARRRWTRAFIVPAGHVHSSTGCCTCRPTTAFYWATEYSGKDEAEIVADAGERACTICYPSAPVDAKGSKMYTPDELEAEAAAFARAEKLAESRRKKEEKSLLPLDAKPLRWNGWRVETLHAALAEIKKVYVGTFWHQTEETRAAELKTTLAHPEFNALLEAVASKQGITVEQVKAEAAAKAAPTIKKALKA